MARIVLERRFDPETGKADFDRAGKDIQRCIETRDVTPIRSVLSADFTRAYCEFEAPDADTLRSALRQAGIRFERVWAAHVIDW
jgi:hypothetical protein